MHQQSGENLPNSPISTVCWRQARTGCRPIALAGRRAAAEHPKVDAAIANHLKRLAIAGARQQGGGIAADRHRPAGQKTVVIIQIKEAGLPGDAAVVAGRLAAIFADIFEVIQFEGAHCPR